MKLFCWLGLRVIVSQFLVLSLLAQAAADKPVQLSPRRAAVKKAVPQQPEEKRPELPAWRPLVVPPRVGIFNEVKLTLAETVQRVLANDRELEISRIAKQEAGYNISAAKGYYDPRIGVNAFRSRSVVPIATLIGGAANGKLTQKQLSADPQISGLSPWLGGSYKLDFLSARQQTDSTFVTLNPQFVTSLNLNLTQPLWRGLRFDENRYRLQVARKNQILSSEQLRQRTIEVVTQAIETYWELDYAYRNLDVQIQAVRLAEQQDASNRRQVLQGLLAPIEVVATQTQAATFQQSVFTAQDMLTQAENNLKALMLPSRTDLMWGAALTPETPVNTGAESPSLADAVKQALLNRPEIALNHINIDVNQLDARLSQEQARPQIDAVATFGLQGLSGRPLPPGPNPLTGNTQALFDRLNVLSANAGLPPLPPFDLGGGQIPAIFPGGYSQSITNLTGRNFASAQFGVQVSIPLRNRTALAQVAVSKAEGKRLSAQRAQVEMAVESDVRNTLQSVSSSRARLESATLARRSAEDQYNSEQRQFQAGTSSVFLVLQRQTDFVAARSREVRARADLGRALAELDRATARTIEAQNLQVAAP